MSRQETQVGDTLHGGEGEARSAAGQEAVELRGMEL